MSKVLSPSKASEYRPRLQYLPYLEGGCSHVAKLDFHPASRRCGGGLASAGQHCSAVSVIRKLVALTSSCEFRARHGVRLEGLMIQVVHAPVPRHRPRDAPRPSVNAL